MKNITLLLTLIISNAFATDIGIFDKWIPVDVKIAVHTNNEIGRDYWDSMSIHAVREYGYNGEATMKEVIMALFPIEKEITKDCKRYGIDSDEKCVEFLINERYEDGAKKIKTQISDWINMNPKDKEEKLFFDSGNTILNYINKFLKGHKYIDGIRVTYPVEVVDDYVSVIIDTKNKKILVVATNAGA